jgi:hypothetical protein
MRVFLSVKDPEGRPVSDSRVRMIQVCFDSNDSFPFLIAALKHEFPSSKVFFHGNVSARTGFLS